jgi:hypothetical protein
VADFKPRWLPLMCGGFCLTTMPARRAAVKKLRKARLSATLSGERQNGRRSKPRPRPWSCHLVAGGYMPYDHAPATAEMEIMFAVGRLGHYTQ